MPLDPSIIAGLKPPNMMGISEIEQFKTMLNRNKLTQLEGAEMQRESTSRNALQALYSDPSNIGPDGSPTEEAMQKYAVAGGNVPELQNQLLRRQQTKSAIDRNTALAGKAEQDAAKQAQLNWARRILPVGRSTMAKYNDLLKKGVPTEEAVKQAQAFYSEQLDELGQEGDVPKNFLDAAKTAKFNPYAFSIRIAQFSQMIGEKPERPTHAQSPIGKLQEDLKEGRITRSQFNASSAKLTKSGEATPGGDIVQGSGKTLPKGVKEYVDPKDGKYYAMGNGLAYTLDEKGGWKQVNRNEIPTKVVKVGTAASGMGARESVFSQRMLQAANQATKDLANVTRLPMTVSSGPFGAFGQTVHPNFLDAGKVVLANKMTPEEAQVYQAMSTGFQRTLAAIEAAGLMPSGGLTHQMEAVIFRPGDTQLTKLHKLAQTRQIIESGMEVMLSNPRLSEDEKKLAKSIVTGVTKAVPYTHEDLVELYKAQQKNPKSTLREVMKAKEKERGAAGRKPEGPAGKTGEAGRDFSSMWRKPQAQAKSAAPAVNRSGVLPSGTSAVEQGEDDDDDKDE